MKCAGNFPLWLAPDQVRVITLNDDEALIAYAQPIVAELRANMVRADADFSATPFKAKIFNAEQLRVHAMVRKWDHGHACPSEAHWQALKQILFVDEPCSAS